MPCGLVFILAEDVASLELQFRLRDVSSLSGPLDLQSLSSSITSRCWPREGRFLGDVMAGTGIA